MQATAPVDDFLKLSPDAQGIVLQKLGQPDTAVSDFSSLSPDAKSLVAQRIFAPKPQPEATNLANQALAGTGITVAPPPTVEPRELGGGTTQVARRLGTTVLDKSGQARQRPAQPIEAQSNDYAAQHPIKSILEGVGNLITGSSMPSGVPDQQQGLGTLATRTSDTITGAERPRIESAAQALGAAGNIASMGMGPEVADAVMAGKSALPMFMGLLKGYAAGKGAKGVTALAGGSPEAQDVAEQGASLVVPGIGSLRRGSAPEPTENQSALDVLKDQVPEPVKAGAQTALNVGRRVVGIPEALTPEQAATKALKPRNSIKEWKQTLASALPDARAAADDLNIDPEKMTIDDAMKSVTSAKKNVWSQYQQLLGPNADATIDAAPIADAMEQSISKRFEEQNPQAAAAIRDKALNYRYANAADIRAQAAESKAPIEQVAQEIGQPRKLTLADAEDYMQDVNNELASYYAKHKVNQRVAARDPQTGNVVAEANALRGALTSKLENLTGTDAAAIRKRYGALTQLEDVIQRRQNVFERQQPDSLNEQISKTRAAGKIASGAVQAVIPGRFGAGVGNVVEGATDLVKARAIRKNNDTNSLLQRAFTGTEPRRPAGPQSGSGPEILPPSGNGPSSPSGSLPAFLRGSPEQPGSQLPPFLRVGTPEGATRDTALFQQAKAELGPEASMSAVAQRAQEMKGGQSSKAASIKQAFSHENLHNAVSDSMIDDAWKRLSSGKKLVFGGKQGTLDSRIQSAFDAGQVHSRDDVAAVVNGSAPKGAVLSGEPESDLEAARRGEPGNPQPGPLPFLNRSAKGPRGTSQQGSANLGMFLPQRPKVSENGFFSKAEEVAQNKLPNAGSGEQFAAALRNNGVKPDEMKWSGLDDLLQKPRVTKQEVLDHLAQNNVQVKEVTKGGISPMDAKWLDRMDEILKSGERKLTPIEQEQYNRLTERDSLPRTSGGGTKFESYQLPGGSNYRELLLTLQKPREIVQNADGLYDAYDAHGNKLASNLGREAAERASQAARADSFTGGHFDEPNVLAHVRFNDRTSPDGKKTLFLEELQSDWHQKGRKQGYQQSLTPELEARIAKLEEQRTHAGLQLGVEAGQRYNRLNDEIWRLRGNNAVPDAPFKNTWHELAMKRMLRYAAENGYDRIAWTTGEQQAARYDLSKQVQEVRAFPHGDGTYDLSSRTHDDHLHDIGSHIPAQKLEDYVGKDLAQKIVNGEGRPDESSGKWRIFSGVDLKVGGEGMKGFYDKILPDFLNKYGKKWGARVGQGEVPTSRDMTDDVQVRVNNALRDFGPHSEQYRRALAKAGESGKRSTEPVHQMDITPAMKKSVMEEGQPLFTGIPPALIPGALAAGAAAAGYANKKRKQAHVLPFLPRAK